MKKSPIFVDESNSKLVMTKAFYKRACEFGSAEYYELRKAKAENEGFEVVFGYKASEKTTYNGLTFKVMEAYIKTQPDSEERLMEFEVVKQIAEIKGSKYPLTKKWFLLTYPEYKASAVSESEKATTLAEMTERAKAEAEKKMATIAGTLPAAS